MNPEVFMFLAIIGAITCVVLLCLLIGVVSALFTDVRQSKTSIPYLLDLNTALEHRVAKLEKKHVKET